MGFLGGTTSFGGAFAATALASLPPLVLIVWWLSDSFSFPDYDTTGINWNGFRISIEPCFDMTDAVQSSNCKQQYLNLHPLFMVLGFVVISSMGMMTYNVLERALGIRHAVARIIHGSIQTIALLFCTVGLYVIVHTKKETGNHQFWTMHSVIGLFTYILMCGQWVLGVAVYIVPRLRELRPLHVWMGVGTIISGAAAIVSGINGYHWIWYAFYIPEETTGNHNNLYMMGGILGMWCVVSAAIIAGYNMRLKMVSNEPTLADDRETADAVGYRPMDQPLERTI